MYQKLMKHLEFTLYILIVTYIKTEYVFEDITAMYPTTTEIHQISANSTEIL